jgi:hypothetical protein
MKLSVQHVQAAQNSGGYTNLHKSKVPEVFLLLANCLHRVHFVWQQNSLRLLFTTTRFQVVQLRGA